MCIYIYYMHMWQLLVRRGVTIACEFLKVYPSVSKVIYETWTPRDTLLLDHIFWGPLRHVSGSY